MSIALSIAIRPSPCLRLLQAALCTSVLVAGGLLRQPLLLLAACAALAVLARPGIHCRLDISGVGQLRLTVYQQVWRAHLLPGCTVWPALVLLHLRCEGRGGARWLVVPTDSVGPGELRRLALAVQALAEKT